MRTIINGMFILGGIALCACASTRKVAQSEWAGKPIAIDGKPEEWQQPMQYYHEGTKLNYSIRNDEDKLYMCIVAADQNTQTRIALAGLQVALDSVGGKKKHVTLLYPFPHGDRSLQPMREASSGTVTLEKTVISQANMIRIKGLNFSEEEEEIPLQNSRGINVAIGWTAEGSLVYELALPFKAFMHTVKGKSLGIQLTVKGLSPPEGGMSPPSGGMSGGMPPGGPPAGGPGGAPGGRMPPGGNTMSEMSGDKSLRIVIAMANE